MIDVKEIQILNRKNCQCGAYEFSLKDVKSIDPLQDAHGFYGNIVKHCAIAKCPKCNRKTILLLKQAGQTWEIMNTAKTNDSGTGKQLVQKLTSQAVKVQAEINNNKENISSNEFICPECKRTFKNKLGLNSHMRKHQKNS